MADVFTKDQRSKVMSAVRSRGNASTELRLIALFKERGATGWRRSYPLYGKPDFVFPKRRVAVFADGCFWHGHNCRNLKPAANAEYWRKKIERNRARDAEVTATLEARGWRVARLWECDIKRKRGLEALWALVL